MRLVRHNNISSFTLFIFLLHFTFVFNAKIIFLFTGGNISHKIGIWPLVVGLAERGHHVTLVTSHTKSLLPTHPNIRDVAPEILAKSAGATYNVDRFKIREDGLENEMYYQYEDACLLACKSLLFSNDSVLNDIIDNVEGYDLAFVNSVYGECGTIIASHFGSKVIEFSPSTIIPWYNTPFGLPWEASYIASMEGKYNYPLGYFERVRNVLGYYKWSDVSSSFSTNLENLMKERFGLSTVPSYHTMKRNSSLVFYNAHYSIDYARSLPPMFIPIGGMQCWDSFETLPKDFQDFMDDATDGVVLIAFGSTVDLSSLSDHYLNIFYKMMTKFSSVRFIWRWKGQRTKNTPSNLMGAEWLPQREILNHPNLRAFMTHCGMNSVTEATCFGVPLIGVPLFADQDYTAYRLEAQEIGVKIEIKGLTQEGMDYAVEKILSNPKYKINMKSRSALLKDQPIKPIDAAIDWTEFVLRHDDLSSLKPMGLEEQPWYVRNLVDVYFGIFLVITVFPLLVIFVMMWIVKKCIY